MPSNLEELFRCIYEAQVPPAWINVNDFSHLTVLYCILKTMFRRLMQDISGQHLKTKTTSALKGLSLFAFKESCFLKRIF